MQSLMFLPVFLIRIRKLLGLPDPDPSINKQKKLRKPRCQQFCDFLKTDINRHTESNQQKIRWKTHFLLTSWKPLKRRAGPWSGFGNHGVWIRGSGSVPKRQGSGTPVLTHVTSFLCLFFWEMSELVCRTVYGRDRAALTGAVWTTAGFPPPWRPGQQVGTAPPNHCLSSPQVTLSGELDDSPWNLKFLHRI